MEPAWTDNTVSWLAIRAARCPTETATAELASPRALRSTGNFGRVVDRPRVSISGGRDDVHLPVHGLRRGHPDQAAEAEALRAVRQGRGPRLQPLELPRPPRRAARVPPQPPPQEPQAHPRQARGATRRDGQQRRRHDVVLRPQRQLHWVGRVVDRPGVQLREVTMSGRTIGNLILMTLICVVVFIVFMAVRPTKASAQNFQREAELSDLARPYHPATVLDLISPEAVTCS